MARVEPASIGDYPVVAGCGKTEHGAIDLDCFKFPDANGPPAGVEDGKGATLLSGRVSGGTVSRPTLINGVLTATVTNPVFSLDQPAYDLAVANPTARNRLASVLMTRSDDRCTRDSASIVANESATNGFLNILVTGLASAGAIVTGTRAKTILAGTASFISGSRDHINAAVYKNQVTQAITAAIAGERNRLRDAIDSRRNDSVAAFTVDEMVQRVNEYHQACSFYRGLELVLTSARDYPKIAALVERQQALDDIDRINTEIAAADSFVIKAAGTAAHLDAMERATKLRKLLEAAHLRAFFKNPGSP